MQMQMSYEVKITTVSGAVHKIVTGDAGIEALKRLLAGGPGSVLQMRAVDSGLLLLAQNIESVSYTATN